jgi:hypothetical protein
MLFKDILLPQKILLELLKDVVENDAFPSDEIDFLLESFYLSDCLVVLLLGLFGLVLQSSHPLHLFRDLIRIGKLPFPFLLRTYQLFQMEDFLIQTHLLLIHLRSIDTVISIKE